MDKAQKRKSNFWKQKRWTLYDLLAFSHDPTSICRQKTSISQRQQRCMFRSESFWCGQHDGQMLAEDSPGYSESDLQAEARLQLRLLSSVGIKLASPGDYIRGLLAGYQTA